MRALANSDHPLGPQGIMTRVPGYDPDDVKFIIFGLKLLGRIRACGYYADGYASPPSSYEIYTIDNPLEKMAYL